MSAPPAALLRLREADVVRLCGFAAAARGLELADRHAVARGRREGARMVAAVADPQHGGDAAPCQVSAELAGEGGPAALRWSCSAHPATPGAPGCVHVAALLTAWVRAPADFPADASPAGNATGGAETAPAPPRHQVSQPALMSPPGVPRPRSSGALAEELVHLPGSALLAMARRVLDADLSEHEARAQLHSALADPARLAVLVAQLDSGARQLLAYILLLGGAVTAADLDALVSRAGRAPSGARAEVTLLARYGLLFPAPGVRAHATGAPSPAHEAREPHPPPPGREGSTTSSAADYAPASQRPAPPAGGAGGEVAWRSLAGWRIPPEVRAALALPLPLDPLPTRDLNGPPLLAPPPTELAQRTRPIRVEHASPRTLFLALALLARAPYPLGPHAHDTQEVEAAGYPHEPRRSGLAGGTGPGAAAALVVPGDLPPVRLAQGARAAGLDADVVRLARRVLLWAREQGPGQPLTDLARVPPGERMLALCAGFRLWRDADTPADLADLALPGSPVRVGYDLAHPALRPAALAAEVAGARRFVLRLLAATTPGAWHALDDLLALLWQLDPQFLRGRQQTYATPGWWLERADGPRRPLRPTVREEWSAGEGVFVRALLMGPLRWWGVLDVAHSAGGQPAAFRVSAFGRYLLGDEPDAPPEVAGTLAGEWGPAALPTRDGGLAVQPVAAGSGLLDALDRWARVGAVANGRLLYALSSDLACAAFDRGAAPGELPARLRVADAAGSRVAEVAAARLAEWHAAYGQTRIENGWALLEARDEPALMEALALAPKVAARCRRLDATHALVPQDDVAALQTALAKRGYSA